MSETLDMLANQYKMPIFQIIERMTGGNVTLNNKYDKISGKAIKVALQVKQF